MAPFNEDFYGLDFGEFQAAMDYKQNKYGGGNVGSNLGGQGGGQQPQPAYVPPAADQKFFNPPQQQVGPPSNERSHEQYMMDLQNEREAAYLRDNPPPVTVASLGGSPLADPGFQVTGTNPATAGMAGPAYVAPGAVTGANLSPTTFENLETMNEGGPSNYPQINWHAPPLNDYPFYWDVAGFFPAPPSGWEENYGQPPYSPPVSGWVPQFQLGSASRPHPRERGYATWGNSPHRRISSTPDWWQQFLAQKLVTSPDRRSTKYMGNWNPR